MKIANNFISTGEIEYALITTGEIPSKLMYAVVDRLKKGVSLKMARNIIGALSVGDAGGAVIIGKSINNTTEFDLFNVNVDSAHTNKCLYKTNSNGALEGQMLMGEISNTIIRAHENLIDDTLNKLGWNNFDWLLTHQMGQRPFDKLSLLNGTKLSKMVKTFDKLGNVTSVPSL